MIFVRNRYHAPLMLVALMQIMCTTRKITRDSVGHISLFSVCRIKEIFKYSANAADNTMKVIFFLFIEDRV